ncbi:MAG: 4Fe-4S dicluster domain-containing protein [Ignavibacterium sp.]|jgi:ferredoxin|nr:4Fe-4S dicluster domain-containing protein [Ignavibacterium sp.]
MSMIINDDCINCAACASECPESAIFIANGSGHFYNNKFQPLSTEHYFILPELCNECAELEEIKCISVCPMDAIKVNNNFI